MSQDTASSEQNMLSNILHNYGAQIFLALAGVVTLPFLMGKMGPDLYAFVAIYFTVQTVFSVLDGGLSGALAREFALRRTLKTVSLTPRSLISLAEIVFVIFAISGFVIVVASSGFVTARWLKVPLAMSADARLYFLIIGAISALRLVSGLYRSVLIGYEKQKNLSYINIVATFVRYFLVIPFLDVFGVSGTYYFYFQLCITLLEFILLRKFATSLVYDKRDAGFVLSALKYDLLDIFKKSSQIWLLTIMWVVTNQIDKILLSGHMPLAEFGYFSMVSTLSSGLLMLGSPVTTAAMPRISVLFGEKNYSECIAVYFRMSTFLSMIALPVSLVLIACPEHALFVFTNSAVAAKKYAHILACYSMGSYMLLLAGLTFLLNYGAGRLSGNVLANLGYVLLLVMAMLFAVKFYSVIGAAITWLLVNVLYVFVIVRPLNEVNGVNLHFKWLRCVIYKPLFLMSLPFLISLYFSPVLTSKIYSLWWLVLVYLFVGAPLCLRFLLLKMKGEGPDISR